MFHVELGEQLFPHIAHNAGLKITNLELVALVKNPGSWQSTVITVTTASNVQTPTLVDSSGIYGGHPSASTAYASGVSPGAWDVSVPKSQQGLDAPAEWVDDMILIATYELELVLN